MIEMRNVGPDSAGMRLLRRPFSWSTLGFRTLTPFHRLQLLYVCFWLIVPCFSNRPSQWLALAAAFAVFLPFYTLLHEGLTRATSLVGLLGQLLLAAIYVPDNLSAFGIYVFIATGINHVSERPRTFYRLLGVLCGFICLQALLLHLPVWEPACACASCLIAGVTVKVQCDARRADARLRMAHDEIEQLAKTAERERIARDLHDVLGHTLSLIAVKSELAARLVEAEPQRALQELAEIQATARRALAETRQTVSGYRARGLRAELQDLSAALASAGVAAVALPAELPRLSASSEAALTLILREAVTNVVRHAGARTCAIRARQADEQLVVEVEDDGRGIQGSEGNGMSGMRERLSDLGGALLVQTGTGGTLLRATLPLAAAPEPEPEAAALPLRTGLPA